MAFKINPTSSFTKFIIVGELVLVSYLLYTLTTSVYKSYQIDLHIRDFEQENEQIAGENDQKSEDFQYYSSDRYIEKIAKQNLGLVNSGEEVIVIPSLKTPLDGIIGAGSANSDVDDDYEAQQLTNSQKWWIFFFDRS